jgi:F0F1-type ATP synthase gamma subunit
MNRIVEALALSSESTHPLFEQRVVNKQALIVISTDKELSGPFISYFILVFSTINSLGKTYGQEGYMF